MNSIFQKSPQYIYNNKKNYKQHKKKGTKNRDDKPKVPGPLEKFFNLQDRDVLDARIAGIFFSSSFFTMVFGNFVNYDVLFCRDGEE